MNDVLLKEIYDEVVKIRKKIDMLEEIIIPKEKVSEKELLEIEKLKEESIEGEHIEWEKLKRELSV
ncbi:hypothetical protein [Candidatus Pyrohabitans sp.]